MAEFRVIFEAVDRLSPVADKVRESVTRLSPAIDRVGDAAGTASTRMDRLPSIAGAAEVALGGLAAQGVARLTGELGKVATAFVGFEAKISGVKAVSGATADEIKQLSDLALQLGKETSFSAAASAGAIEELVKAGVSVADILGGAARASVSLAAAGDIDLASAAEIAANAMNQFSLAGSDMGHVADLIAGAANASSLSVQDFKFSLGQVGAVASTVGLSFDDTATAIAVLGAAGIKGSDAGTSLKTMLMNLQPHTQKASGLFADLGLTLADGSNQFFDATGKIKSMSEIAGLLQEALSDLSEQQRFATLQTLFGTDAIRAAAIVSKAGAEGFTSMAASMAKVSAEAVAAERLNNVAGSIEQLKGSVETLAIMLGLSLAPTIKAAVDAALEFANQLISLTEFVSQNQAAQEALVAILVGAGAVIMGALVPAFIAWAAAAGAAAVATIAAALPFIALAAAIGAVVFIAIQIVKHWDDIVAATNDLITTITQLGAVLGHLASEAFQALLDVGTSIVDGIRAGIEAGWDALVGFVMGRIRDLVRKIKKAVGFGSPAAAFIPIGAAMAQGIGVGFRDAMATLTPALSIAPNAPIRQRGGASIINVPIYNYGTIGVSDLGTIIDARISEGRRRGKW